MSTPITAIGRLGMVQIGFGRAPRSTQLDIPIRIKAARYSFGRTDYLVSPIGGQGSVWVSSERVKISNEVQP